MAQQVLSGRYTASPATDTVTVFLIGMRANRWWKLGPTYQTAAAMPRMLKHLMNHPESGLLGFHSWFGRTTLLLSYWQSPEHLQRFAAEHDAPHLAAWHRFMRESAGTGDVGIWHETYQVRVKDQEAVYSDMPPFGLAAATSRTPIGRGTSTARQRLQRHS
ncbi:transcriptional regulator [Bacillus sp. SRB_336]|nr:transcriptional regulator [Bacillus sp. SRB_336]